MSEPAAASTADRGDVVVVVLAAGAGTRMRSRRAKVLHGFAGRSLLGHALAATEPLSPAGTVVVVGHDRGEVTAHLAEISPAARPVVQTEQLGTGHAVGVALGSVPPTAGATVLVLPGDAPLLRPETLVALLEQHRASGAAATLLTARVADPTGYGRVLRNADGLVERVVEHVDATPAERAVDEVAAGVYVFDEARLRYALDRIGRSNAQNEQYLPDAVALLREAGDTVAALVAKADEIAGVNDRVQLAAAHATYRQRLNQRHMRAGVTIVDPATTWIDADVELAADATILPGVHLLAGTTVAANAVVGPDCTITATSVGAGAQVTRSVTDGASIGPDCVVGPFAYLRPGAELVADVKVGTFVEVKKSQLRAGAKVPHLSYVGDATIGEGTNVGAATIFANFDGVNKNRSVLGRDVRIGSDTTIVAPVTIGDGAYTGAGTVVREDVPAGALAVSMGPQRSIEGWADRRHAAPPSASPATAVHSIAHSAEPPSSPSDAALTSDPGDHPS